MGGNKNTTSTTSAPAPQAMQAYTDLINNAASIAKTPYQPYGGVGVASANPEQQAGVAGVNNYAYSAQPDYQLAGGYIQGAANPITTSQINQYYSPYVQDVVNTTEQQFNNQNQQQQEQVQGNAIAQGALGGNRTAIAAAELANQQQSAQAPVIAGLENTGYNTAVQTAMQQFQQNPEYAATALGSIGAGMQSAGLAGAGTQFGTGTALQQYANPNGQPPSAAQTAWDYQQYLNQLAYPYQNLSWQAGIDTGAGSLMGGTGTTTGPAPSIASQIAGFGGLAAGLGGQAGLLSFLAKGGAVHGGIANRSSSVPESSDTLHAQQRQLVHGHRRAQLFPHGTKELSLPSGMKRVHAASGVFHFNPNKIDGHHIQMLSASGHEHEILDLGPFSKHDVVNRLRGGEIPVAVVERDHHGTEVRTAAGTHVTAPHQVAAMERTKSPGHTINVEHPFEVLHARNRAHRAAGGTVGLVPHLATGGVGATPYAGGMSYVPTAGGITHGSGPPKPPTLPNQNQTLQNQASQIGQLTKGIVGNTNSSPAATPGAPPTFADQTQDFFQDLPDTFSDANFSWRGGGVGGYARGGVARYADGGGDNANFSDRFTGDTTDPTMLSTLGPNVLGSISGPDASLNGVANAPVSFPDSPVLGDSAPLPRPRPHEADFEAPEPGTPAPSPPDLGPEQGPPIYKPTGIAMSNPGSAPRGIRNNNPLNIENGQFASLQSGYVGPEPQGRFAQFATPEAGFNAATNLLSSYGQRGINTVDGIISRWAPASDGNDTRNYAHIVANQLGVKPDQPLNMDDPNVRAALAHAMAKVESGGTGVGNTKLAYNGDPQFAPGVAAIDEAANKPAGVAQHEGFDWSPNNKLWGALSTAGAAMMASTSPYFGVNLGRGALAGEQQYAYENQVERQQKMDQNKIDQETKKLRDEAERHSADLAERTGYHQSEIELRRREALIKEMAPVTIYDQDTNQPSTARRNPDGSYSDIHSGKILLDPNGSPVPSGQPNKPLQQPQQPAQSGIQKAGFNSGAGFYLENSKAVENGEQYDYAGGGPIVEKGTPVQEPKPVAGHSSEALKTDAEYWLQTGKLPIVSRGQSPVAQAQQAYRSAVQNYGSALAASRGLSPQQVAEMWRTAPGMLRYILGADGRATVSLGTAIRHLDTLQEYAKAWNAGDIQTLNRLRSSISREFGSEAATNLETIGKIVGPEIIKAIGVAGAGTHEDREAAEKQFSTAVSPEQILGAVGATQKLLGGQLEGKRRQAAAAGVSEERFKNLIGDRPYEILTNLDNRAAGSTQPQQLSPKDKEALDWANANPNDPRAAQIKKKLGTQ